MKRTIIAAMILSSLISAPARADTDQYDFDLIHRPRGTTDAQVDAGVQAATQVCDPMGRQSYGSKAFLSCMRMQGYKFTHVEHKRSPRAPADPYFSSTAKVAPGHFIDHDNGLDCQNTGGAEICETPTNGTVHYYNPDQGLPCTRTGIVEICSNM